jgi:hypothetical protein
MDILFLRACKDWIVQTLVEDFLQSLRHERGQSAVTFYSQSAPGAVKFEP